MGKTYGVRDSHELGLGKSPSPPARTAHRRSAALDDRDGGKTGWRGARGTPVRPAGTCDRRRRYLAFAGFALWTDEQAERLKGSVPPADPSRPLVHEQVCLPDVGTL
jgi:hypothetical protein